MRRVTADIVHGWTAPLIVRSDGTKFGKSEGENIWLSASGPAHIGCTSTCSTSPTPTSETLLLRLTTVPLDEIRRTVVLHEQNPASREGQRRVATEITTLVHGAAVAAQVQEASSVLFGQPLEGLDAPAFELLAAEVPTTRLAESDLLGAAAVDLLAATGLAPSKGDVRRTPAGYYVNQVSLEIRGTSRFERTTWCTVDSSCSVGDGPLTTWWKRSEPGGRGIFRQSCRASLPSELTSPGRRRAPRPARPIRPVREQP